MQMGQKTKKERVKVEKTTIMVLGQKNVGYGVV